MAPSRIIFLEECKAARFYGYIVAGDVLNLKFHRSVLLRMTRARRNSSSSTFHQQEEGESAANGQKQRDLVEHIDPDEISSSQDSEASTGTSSNNTDDDDDDADEPAEEEDELAGVTADTPLRKHQQSQRVYEHIKKLRSERREDKRRTEKDERAAKKIQRQTQRIDAKNKAEESKKRQFTVSVTIEWQGRDLPIDVHTTFCAWCVQTATWWAAAYEKGATCGFWHIQAEIEGTFSSLNNIKRSWNSFVGWDVNKPPCKKVNVCVKELCGKGLHTRLGILGYTRKDIDKYDGHLWSCSPTVTDEEKEEADVLYVQLGKGDKGGTCVLTDTNILDRAIVFFQRFVKNPMYAQLDVVLAMMLRTGRYTVHGKFLTSNGAMIYGRAQLAFQCRVCPPDTNVEDVNRIFFATAKPRDDTCTPRTPIRTPRTDHFSDMSEYVALSRSDKSSTSSSSSRKRRRKRGKSRRSLDFNKVLPDEDVEKLGDTTRIEDKRLHDRIEAWLRPDLAPDRHDQHEESMLQGPGLAVHSRHFDADQGQVGTPFFRFDGSDGDGAAAGALGSSSRSETLASLEPCGYIAAVDSNSS